MWFKNLHLFALPESFSPGASRLEAALAAHPLLPCPAAAMQSQGWVAPGPDGALVHSHGKRHLIALGTEQRLLPASVIRQAALEKAEALEKQQGFAPGRKQMRELRDRVADELRPRAFIRRRSLRALLDLDAHRLIVDSATPKAAEDLASVLRADLGDLPAVPLDTQQSAGNVMTQWLSGGKRPGAFQLREDCELTSPEEAKSAIRYVRHSLGGPELRSLLGTGKSVTRLGLTWRERLSFVLGDKLAVKRLRFEAMDADGATSKGAKSEVAEADAFAADFALMCGELDSLLKELLDALGGAKPS